MYGHLGSWLQGVTQIYTLTSSYYCQFFSVNNMEIAIRWEKPLAPMSNWKVWNTLFFVVYLLKSIFRQKVECSAHASRSGGARVDVEHLFGGPQAPPLEDPTLCLEGPSEQPGVKPWEPGAAGVLVGSAMRADLLQRRQSTVGKVEELPREMSGSISWTNSMLLEIQTETRIPGKCLPLLLALIFQRRCAGKRDGWVDLPFFGTSWELLPVPQGPSPWAQLAPALPHMPASHNCPWPWPALLLLQSLLPRGAVLWTLSLNTIMLQWIFFVPLRRNWRFFIIFFHHLKLLFCLQPSPLKIMSPSPHLWLRCSGILDCTNKTHIPSADLKKENRNPKTLRKLMNLASWHYLKMCDFNRQITTLQVLSPHTKLNSISYKILTRSG